MKMMIHQIDITKKGKVIIMTKEVQICDLCDEDIFMEDHFKCKICGAERCYNCGVRHKGYCSTCCTDDSLEFFSGDC